ncbi:MAG: hypothetical protein C9356_01450 [Oleiphilus sp.]|nr:MAG: hypothetical protein C9356_01450 [Oleiphilus sp.]
MPIAHLTLRPGCPDGAGDLITLWSKASGQAAEHMTINVHACQQQWGAPYTAMASLLLPSLWSDANRKRLQEGLAQALAQYFGVSIDQVHVITQVLESGHVVENGRTLDWE